MSLLTVPNGIWIYFTEEFEMPYLQIVSEYQYDAKVRMIHECGLIIAVSHSDTEEDELVLLK